MKLKKFIQQNASWVVLFCLLVLFSLLSPNFRTVNNFLTILRQVSVNGITAIGLAIILISGGIDLSTGSQCAVSGMLCALLAVNLGIPSVPAMILAILVNSIVFGLLNGCSIAFTGMPALIATLGTMNIARGVAYLISGGYTIFGLPDGLKFLGQASVSRFPVSTILLIIMLILANFILNHTTYGRALFAVGANKEAARLTGINATLVTISAYVVGSLFIGLGGVVLMSRLNSGMPSAGSDIYIEVLAGCVIGGVSSKGGEGNVFRMIGGVLVMGVISNGMNVAGLSEYWQYVAKGGILLISVAIDSYRSLVSARKKNFIVSSKAAAKA